MSNLLNMLEVARSMLTNSYSPYSNFPVSACLRTTSNELFTGCNIENASYSLTLCAEAAAIAHMVSAGQTEIKEVVVMGQGSELCAPCGACRQRLREFADPTTLIHICSPDGVRKTMTMEELLPVSFGPHNLARKHDSISD